MKRRKKRPVEERFWSKVDKSGECWEWLGSRTPVGYGQFHVQEPKRTQLKAHRVAYEYLVGPIPEGLVIDHKCHNRGCVNPAHLRPVTDKQNQENRKGASWQSKTGIRGVSRHTYLNGWVAQVQHYGKSYNAGLHKTLEAAEAAVIAKRNELYTHNDLDRKSAA